MTDNNKKELSWSFYRVWNQSLETRKSREMKARDNMWAGELGGAFIDRFLKMNAVPPTNPPNPRSLRKFEAGNMMEWVVEMVLRRAGILLEDQSWVSYQYPDLLKVTGKLDFLAGGNPDWEKARREIKELELPEFFNRATEEIIEHLAKLYPDGLRKIILEVKSCSSFMFERYEKIGANKSHELQLFHYLKARNYAEGHIVYICKDDLRMLECPVFNPSDIEDEYRKDIETMTAFIREDKRPPLEEEILFEGGRFSTNWRIAYSNYLTMLYGYENQTEYDDKFRKITAQWNRVLGRCVRGDKMTDLNLKVIEDIKKRFPDFDRIVEEAKASNAGLEEEVEGGAA